jgi:hypothetical protein
VITASGHQCHLDAARGGVDQRIAMRVRQPAAAVEERSVDVDGEQPNH